MAKKTVAAREPVGAGSSMVAITTASIFIALAAAISFASDDHDDARSLHLRGSLAADDMGAAPAPLPVLPKHV